MERLAVALLRGPPHGSDRATRSVPFKPKSNEVTMRYCKQLTSTALTMGLLLLLACGESPVTVAADLAPSFAKGGKNGGGGPNSGTPLSVTLSTVGDVTADDGGSYDDGVDGVMAIIDQNDDLKFDIDAPKKNGVARKICFDFGTVITPVDESLLPSDPTMVCGGPLWNTRGGDVELSEMSPDDSGEFGSRFIVSPGNGFEYKVRYGADELACPGLSLPNGSSSGVSVTGGADTDFDGKSDSWTLDATDRVAFVSAHDTKLKGKSDPGFVCVGIYAMSWAADLVKN